MQQLDQTVFILTDSNSPLNQVYSSINLDFVVNELLVIIDTSLSVLTNNSIKAQIDSLNFDNLQIIETISNGSPRPFIVNTYKLNLKTLSLSLTSLNSNTCNLNGISVTDVSPKLKFMVNLISNKINIITGGKVQQKPQSKSLQPQSKSLRVIQKNKKIVDENPIKKVFEETQGLLKKVGNKADVGVNKRLIPTLDSTESESDIEEEDNETSESSEYELELKNEQGEQVTIKEPNVPRQMNSLLVEKNVKSNTTVDLGDLDEENVDPETIRKTMEALQELKKVELKRLEDLKKNTTGDMENFSRYCNDLGDKKRELRRNQERETERRNKFEANKDAYFKMKKHIDSGKLSESKISELFINEYPIYKFMDEKNLLDEDDDYVVYLNIYDEMYPPKNEKNKEDEPKSTYIPHNIHYLSEDEQKKYISASEQKKDLIDEFIVKHNDKKDKQTDKKFPPLEDVLKGIDSDEEEENKVTCIDVEYNNNEFAGINFEEPIKTSTDIKMDLIANAIKNTLSSD